VYTELIKYIPNNIVNIVLQYTGSRIEWVRYWKNLTLRQLKYADFKRPYVIRFKMPDSIVLINNTYLSNLANDIMDNHISLLREMVCFETSTTPKYNILLRTIKLNIKLNMSELKLPGLNKMFIQWVTNN